MPRKERPSVKAQILQGLRLAALLTEDPRQRIARLNLQQRQREADDRFGLSSERNEIFRERDRRFAASDKKREERADLSTRLELDSRGQRLTSEQQAGLDSGDLLGIDFGAGVSVGSGGFQRIPFAGEEFAIPNRQAQADIDLQQTLDRQAALDKLKKVPLPGKLSEIIGLDEGTPVDPGVLDDLLRAANQLDAPAPLDKSTFTDAAGNTDRVFIDPSSGEIKQRVKLGRKRVPGSATGSKKARLGQKVTEVASDLLLKAGGDPKKAIADLARQARFDESGFLAKNLVPVAAKLKALILSSGSDLPTSLNDLLGIEADEPVTAGGRGRQTDAAKEFDRFLKARGGG